MNRRKFLQNMTGLTLATLASGKILLAQAGSNKLKIVVFWEENFPVIDGLNLTKEILQNALGDHDLTFAKADELKAKLNEKIDLFVNPYGSAFPAESWPAILNHLKTGGNFLNLGGRPFSVPVKNQNGLPKPETGQVNYHKRLGILQYFSLAGSAHSFFRSLAHRVNDRIKPKKVFEMYVRLTNVFDFPEDSGSDGRREAEISALLYGYKRRQIESLVSGEVKTAPPVARKKLENFVWQTQLFPISAPIVEINRLRGEFAGGRWVFVNYEGEIDAETIKSLAVNTAFGAFEITAKPLYACCRQNESPILNINFLNPKADLAVKSAEIWVTDSEEKRVWAGKIKLNQNNSASEKLKPLPPGFYEGMIYYEIELKSGISHKLAFSFGFWVLDEKLLQTGEKFTADRHFLYRNNAPFPVVGATYMASDVHRRFLLEPNAAVWDTDFAAMKAAGVNMIRTGIWTGWKLFFDEKGNVREEVLRAFEAFILTSKKYDIPVIFTFFAFMPEMFGGRNAYLDPQAIEGQKRFLSAFAGRVKPAKDVVWDLINEPSFANPKNLWSCRPNYDEFERTAWKDWLKMRFNESNEEILAGILREKWRLSGEENPFELPKMEDFDGVNIFSNRRPLKTLDFRLFAQYVFENWARELSKTLKENGNPAQMVTVGQDEAGLNDSPSQQFHASALSFTGLHNWWSNDDLLWDNVVSKSPAKPNMIQETGVMFYEKTDGSQWRGEQTVADLLERKMVLALGANACGFIEWIWNTNPFMNIDNEAGIGFLRVDGTAKPELFSFINIAKFANENRNFFKNKKDEKTLLVIPHSYQFTPRNFAWEATKKAVRAFHYHCRRTLRAVSEYNLETIWTEENAPNLIIVPSPRVLTDAAWENLLKLAEKGSIIAMTGFFEENEHLQPRKRLGAYFSIDGAKAVAQFETARIENKNYQVRFAGEKIQRVERADFPQNYVANVSIGKGGILWLPLPIEIGETIEPIAAFYNFALKRARISPVFSLKNDNPAILVRPTEFEKAFLYLIINESSTPQKIELTHLATAAKIEFDLAVGQTKLVFIEKKTGKILNKSG